MAVIKQFLKFFVVIFVLVSLVALVGCGGSANDVPADPAPQQPNGSDDNGDAEDQVAVLTVNAKEVYYQANGTMLFYVDLTANRQLKEGEEYVHLTISLGKDNELVKEFTARYSDLDFGNHDRLLLGAVTSYWLSAEERELIGDIDEVLVDAVVADYRSAEFTGPRYHHYEALDYEVYPNIGTVLICTWTGEEIQYTHTVYVEISEVPAFTVIGRIEFTDGSSMLIHLPYDGPSGQIYKEDFDLKGISEIVVIPSVYLD